MTTRRGLSGGVVVALSVAATALAADDVKTTLPTVTAVATPAPIFPEVELPAITVWDNRSGSAGAPFNPSVSQVVRVEPNDCAGNPVERFSGNKTEAETDFVSGGEMPLTMHRVYSHFASAFNHTKAVRGILGTHWRSSFDYSVEMQANNYGIWAWRPDGRRVFLRSLSDGSGRYAEVKAGNTLNPKMYAETILNGSTIKTVVLHTEDGDTETYPVNYHDQWYGSGYISERRNAQGVLWRFTYSGLPPYGALSKVEHSSGRSVQFQVRPGVLAVIDPAGNAYQYNFADGRLVSVNQPGSPATTIAYHYENAKFPAALTGKSFDGVRYSTFAYDDSGRAISTEHAGGVERFTFAYAGAPSGAWYVTETNPLGRQAVHAYDNGKKTSITGHASANCGNSFKAMTYDANGFQDVVTDFANNKTDYDYDDHGHVVKKVEGVGTGSGRVTLYAWDETRNRPARVTVSNVSETSYGFTQDNLVAWVTVRDIATNQSRTTSYRYTRHGNGMLASMTVDGPMPGTTDAVVSNYNASGDLVSTSNGLGHAVSYSNYNALGKPGRVTTETGAVTDYA